MCWDCDGWMTEGRLRRREIRHDVGGAPEIMPHRKKRKKNKGAARVDHKHIYESNGWEKRYRSVYKRLDTPLYGLRYTFVEDKTQWNFVRRFFCLECGKAGKVEYDSPRGNSWTYYNA